jgi:hypothetical protein
MIHGCIGLFNLPGLQHAIRHRCLVFHRHPIQTHFKRRVHVTLYMIASAEKALRKHLLVHGATYDMTVRTWVVFTLRARKEADTSTQSWFQSHGNASIALVLALERDQKTVWKEQVTLQYRKGYNHYFAGLHRPITTSQQNISLLVSFPSSSNSCLLAL